MTTKHDLFDIQYEIVQTPGGEVFDGFSVKMVFRMDI